MKEVTGINQNQADEQTIATLKDLLEKAESGELRSLIFIDKYRDGKVGHGWSGQPCRKMIGAIEELKFEYHSRKYLTVEV